MIKTKPTVTIAISAYNEEANILNFLRSVLMQKSDEFELKQIWIHSDGSSDNTVKMVKSLDSDIIKIWDHKIRIGKSSWLNKIYHDLDTDFLVQSDADVVFAHQFVVRDLIRPLIMNKDVGMCGGNPSPIQGNSLYEKLVRVAFEPYQIFRRVVRGGDNAFSAVGQILAYRRDLLKKIHIPKDMVTNDIFTYFSCLSLGWKYKYAESARVYFQSPRNLRDIIRQNTRFRVGYKLMFRYFPKDLVKREMKIPNYIYYKAILRQIIKYPHYSILYFLINKYIILKMIFAKDKLDAKWPIALTTKEFTKDI